MVQRLEPGSRRKIGQRDSSRHSGNTFGEWKSSASKNSQPSSCARALPSVDLPDPETPIVRKPCGCMDLFYMKKPAATGLSSFHLFSTPRNRTSLHISLPGRVSYRGTPSGSPAYWTRFAVADRAEVDLAESNHLRRSATDKDLIRH